MAAWQARQAGSDEAAQLHSGVLQVRRAQAGVVGAQRARRGGRRARALRAARRAVRRGAAAGRRQEARRQRGEQGGGLRRQAGQDVRVSRAPARQPGQRVGGLRAPGHPGRQPREQACAPAQTVCGAAQCSAAKLDPVTRCGASGAALQLRCTSAPFKVLGRGVHQGLIRARAAPMGRSQAGCAASASPGGASPSAAAQAPNSSACASAAFQSRRASSATAARSCASAPGPASAQARSASPAWRCAAACRARARC